MTTFPQKISVYNPELTIKELVKLRVVGKGLYRFFYILSAISAVAAIYTTYIAYQERNNSNDKRRYDTKILAAFSIFSALILYVAGNVIYYKNLQIQNSLFTRYAEVLIT